MNERDRVELQERYRTRWREYGYDVRTLGWNKDCQWVRFSAALDGLRAVEYATVMDVGCGFGDMLDFLHETGWRGQYVGVDVSPELLDEAARRHAGNRDATFICGDVQELELPAVDAAIALGTLNHRLHESNLACARRTLDAMWRVTRHVVVCDFLSTTSDPDRRRDDLFYADPCDVFAVAAQYSRRVMLHHAYMPFEFQVKIWHGDGFDAAAPVFPPYDGLADASRRRLR